MQPYFNLSPKLNNSVAFRKKKFSFMVLGQLFKEQMFQLHPDVSDTKKSTAKDFIEVKNAYETLMDPNKRSKYDAQFQERR